VVDVNIKGVMYGIAAVLPIMREQKSGHVINLSSVAGDEIRSTNISPGAVATELTSTITDDTAKQAADEIYEVAIDADAVARAIVYAIEQPADVDINEIILRPTAQEL